MTTVYLTRTNIVSHMELASNTTYVLTEDIVLANDHGLIIPSSVTNVLFDGWHHVITVRNVPNFHGVFRGAFITVRNLTVSPDGSTTLAEDAGWIIASRMSATVLNCESTGAIPMSGGGIVGAYGQRIVTNNCRSYGEIGSYGGGIVGSSAIYATATGCSSVGAIGRYAGGIFGTSTANGTVEAPGSATVTACFSKGAIDENAGGIVGAFSGSVGRITVDQCYSEGDIGSGAGGIIGKCSEDTSGAVFVIKNSYSRGGITETKGLFPGGGGIIGADATSAKTYALIQNCYSAAGTEEMGLAAKAAPQPALLTSDSGPSMLFQRSTYAMEDGAWDDAAAAAALTGVGSIWAPTTAGPYRLLRELPHPPTITRKTYWPTQAERLANRRPVPAKGQQRTGSDQTYVRRIRSICATCQPCGTTCLCACPSRLDGVETITLPTI